MKPWMSLGGGGAKMKIYNIANVLVRLPCYDFTPVINPTFGGVLIAVRLPTSGVTDSHGVTGGVYKARERIHRGILIRDY